MNKIFIIITLIVFYSCSTKNDLYTLEVVLPKGFNFFNIQNDNSIKINELGNEIGEVKIYDDLVNQIVKKGNYENGFPIGKWEYNFDTLIDISWKKQSGLNKTKFSVPQTWKHVPNYDFEYVAMTASSIDTFISSNYFMITINNLQEFKNIGEGNALENYEKYIKQDYYNKYQQVGFQTYDIICQSKNKFKLICIQFEEKESTYHGISFIGTYKDEFIECTLKKNGALEMTSYLELLTIARSLQIKDHRWFSPLDFVKTLNGKNIEILE